MDLGLLAFLAAIILFLISLWFIFVCIRTLRNKKNINTYPKRSTFIFLGILMIFFGMWPIASKISGINPEWWSTVTLTGTLAQAHGILIILLGITFIVMNIRAILSAPFFIATFILLLSYPLLEFTGKRWFGSVMSMVVFSLIYLMFVYAITFLILGIRRAIRSRKEK